MAPSAARASDGARGERCPRPSEALGERAEGRSHAPSAPPAAVAVAPSRRTGRVAEHRRTARPGRCGDPVTAADVAARAGQRRPRRLGAAAGRWPAPRGGTAAMTTRTAPTAPASRRSQHSSSSRAPTPNWRGACCASARPLRHRSRRRRGRHARRDRGHCAARPYQRRARPSSRSRSRARGRATCCATSSAPPRAFAERLTTGRPYGRIRVERRARIDDEQRQALREAAHRARGSRRSSCACAGSASSRPPRPSAFRSARTRRVCSARIARLRRLARTR